MNRRCDISLPEHVQVVADAAAAKKAHDIVVLDLQGIANFTDFFVICDAPSERQVRAIYEEILASMTSANFRVLHVEGAEDGAWILMDCGSIIVHIFRSERRKYYDIERLWADAPLIFQSEQTADVGSDEDDYIELPWK